MISLRNRLVLTYTLFICIGVLVLSILTNTFAGKLFSNFVKENIAAQSKKIAESIADQYNPGFGGFNAMTTMALGMNFVHQGYIISIEDTKGAVIWDARECDMKKCSEVIQGIESRMKDEFQLTGGFQINTLPLVYVGKIVGYVHIEYYAPFFYSDSESSFLHSLNQFLIVIGIAFAVLSIVISTIFATTLSKPILKAAHTAKKIAGGNLSIRISDVHRTIELHELFHSINELAAALENGERWQKRMINDIAHELRTPLTTLQGNMEAMIEGVWEPTAERLTSCHEEIVRLNKLVEDLGLLSILEQENLVLRKTSFDIQKLLSVVAEQFTPIASEKGVALSYACESIPFYGDYDRLKQVLLNAVSNAVKYTDKGRIELEAIDLVESIEIKISDTGIGISQSDLPHVFERFYRSDKSRSRATGGAGIGLTVASTVVTAHDGTISVTSENGVGSVFSIKLPKGTQHIALHPL